MTEVLLVVVIAILLIFIGIIMVMFLNKYKELLEHNEYIVEKYDNRLLIKDEELNDIRKLHEDINKRWIERFFVQDIHQQAELRTLLFLILERNGIKLPANQQKKLFEDFVQEGLKNTEAISNEERRLREKYLNGEGK